MRAARHIAILFGAALAVAGSGSLAQAATNPNKLPPGPGSDLVYATCQTCHSLQYLTASAGISKDAWDGILTAMTQYGLSITPANRAKILKYLVTYLGPNPPPPPTKTVAAAPAKVDGKTAFDNNCSGCHQKSGQGVAGNFPPLAGNEDLMHARLFPVYVVLNGLSGKIEANGQSFNGQMPAFSFLSDDQIAAIVNYVRGAWGNDKKKPASMAAIDAATVKTARANKMTPAEVHAYRAKKDE